MLEEFAPWNLPVQPKVLIVHHQILIGDVLASVTGFDSDALSALLEKTSPNGYSLVTQSCFVRVESRGCSVEVVFQFKSLAAIRVSAYYRRATLHATLGSLFQAQG